MIRYFNLHKTASARRGIKHSERRVNKTKHVANMYQREYNSMGNSTERSKEVSELIRSHVQWNVEDVEVLAIMCSCPHHIWGDVKRLSLIGDFAVDWLVKEKKKTKKVSDSVVLQHVITFNAVALLGQVIESSRKCSTDIASQFLLKTTSAYPEFAPREKWRETESTRPREV